MAPSTWFFPPSHRVSGKWGGQLIDHRLSTGWYFKCLVKGEVEEEETWHVRDLIFGLGSVRSSSLIEIFYLSMNIGDRCFLNNGNMNNGIFFFGKSRWYSRNNGEIGGSIERYWNYRRNRCCYYCLSHCSFRVTTCPELDNLIMMLQMFPIQIIPRIKLATKQLFNFSSSTMVRSGL